MGTRGLYLLVDTTPAKTILVYRNGDPFFAGRKFVLGRRRVATFEALLEQLNQEVETPRGVRRLYTPTGGTPVLGLDTLQSGGKYVAAGPERFKCLDYFNIAHRKPEKTRKLKKIKPVAHCNIDVPSRWQTFQHQSRHINVFTNGKVFIAPVKIVIPKFSLMEWNNVLARVGEKVFPFGGVRKLFTMDGHLLDSSQDLHDNHFYVAVGLENFKSFPYWKYTQVSAKVQQMHGDTRKSLPKKKKEGPKEKEPHKDDRIPLEPQDSVFYAKEGKKKRPAEPLVCTGAEGDMYKAQTPNMETQGALEVREDQDVQVEMPEDQVPADMVREDEEISDNSPDFESSREKDDRLYEDDEEEDERKTPDVLVDLDLVKGEGGKMKPYAQGDSSQESFEKSFPLGYDTRREASLKNLSTDENVASSPEEEPYVLEDRNTPELLEASVKTEDQRGSPMGQQSQESSPRQPEEKPEVQASFEQSSLGQPSNRQIPNRQESFEHSSLGQPSQEQTHDKDESSVQLSSESLEQSSQAETAQGEQTPGHKP